MLKLENIQKSYSNGFRRPRNLILRNLSHTLEQGKVIGLVGPSGSGKSTLGRMMLRQEKPDRGCIRFSGKDIWQFNRHELRQFRRSVQWVPQHPDAAFNPRLKLGASLKEVFRFHSVCPRGEEQVRLESILSRVSVHPDLLDRYPGQLSGGEIQRLAIARAILTTPSLLILDEVTSMLDISVQAAIIRTLENLHRRYGGTYFFITHNRDLARVFCDRIYHLEQGVLERIK